MKVLLVGGAGFIGSHITKELLKNKEEVIIYDAFLSYISPFESNYQKLLKMRFEGVLDKVKMMRGDIRHKGRFLKVLKEIKPEKVVHLAAIPLPTTSNIHSEDAIGINLNGTVNVLEAIRQIDSVNQYIYTSSSFIYGNFTKTSADETHPTNPIGVYGGTKLAGEMLTKVFGKQYGINYTIIRPSAVYGETDVNRRVSQIFIENALQGKPLILHDGDAKLDFTYIKDLAKGFILALKNEKAIGETFNITRGEGRSLFELIEILKGLIGKVEVITKESTQKRPKRGALDITKARKLLNYNPEYSLEEGMKIYVDFVKNSGILK